MSTNKQRVTTVYVETLDHDHGHWCRTCLLGTGVRVWAMFTQGNCSHMQIRLWCTECQGRDIEVDPDAHHC